MIVDSQNQAIKGKIENFKVFIAKLGFEKNNDWG
jgi:hypothetical protein